MAPNIDRFLLARAVFLLFLTVQEGHSTILSVGDEYGHPVASDGVPTGLENAHSCPPCQRPKLSRVGAVKCVAVPYCCPEKASTTKCLISPCLFFQSSCPRAKYCVPSNCDPQGCSQIYYDSYMNPLKPSECRRYILRRQPPPQHAPTPEFVPREFTVLKSHVQPLIDVSPHLLSPSGLDIDPADPVRASKNAARPSRPQMDPLQKQALLWPNHVGVRTSEKPGKCPSPDSGFYLIRVCSNSCASDSECRGKKKCCSNGCSLQCLNPDRHDPDNYLNYPITSIFRKL